MRGSLYDRRQTHGGFGIIPAHAGLTSSWLSQFISLRDHPRACGAHSSSATRLSCPQGSSPRMRGSLDYLRHLHAAHGIIPAHAGLTNLHDFLFSHFGDHPRACGAHFKSGRWDGYFKGSSPRMRGSLVADSGRFGFPGIIPAHAGLTTTHHRARWARRDHPRACGAHKKRPKMTKKMMGSSPRMRGSRADDDLRADDVGIIPAHAGLTECIQVYLTATRDHPRACGAHSYSNAWSGIRPGSSPRMRGSRHLRRHGQADGGIIPAHAGLTSR